MRDTTDEERNDDGVYEQFHPLAASEFYSGDYLSPNGNSNTGYAMPRAPHTGYEMPRGPHTGATAPLYAKLNNSRGSSSDPIYDMGTVAVGANALYAMASPAFAAGSAAYSGNSSAGVYDMGNSSAGVYDMGNCAADVSTKADEEEDGGYDIGNVTTGTEGLYSTVASAGAGTYDSMVTSELAGAFAEPAYMASYAMASGDYLEPATYAHLISSSLFLSVSFLCAVMVLFTTNRASVVSILCAVTVLLTAKRASVVSILCVALVLLTANRASVVSILFAAVLLRDVYRASIVPCYRCATCACRTSVPSSASSW